MIFLEIAMLVIGLGAVIYSLRMPSGNSTEDSEKDAMSGEETQRESMRLQSMLDSFTTKAELVCDNLEDKMSQMSNEKIMGLSEYSEQVLDKIQKNHEEVVFLYDMMNGKQEELKSLVHDIDSRKAELQDESAKEYQKMKEQEQLLDEMKKNLETDFLQVQTEQGAFRQEFERLRGEYGKLEEEISNSINRLHGSSPEKDFDADFDAEFASQKESENDLTELDEDFRKLLEKKEVSPMETQEEPLQKEDTSFDSSVFDAEIARIEEEETKAMEEEKEEPSLKLSPNYTPLSQQQKSENHNDEIISLYKKGRSILEISKMLSLGQGEVKFVIDLYNAR